MDKKSVMHAVGLEDETPTKHMTRLTPYDLDKQHSFALCTGIA